MKFCKFCNTIMVSEHQTNIHDSHRYKSFHTCPKCGAMCDEDTTKKGNNVITHSEKWYGGKTEKGESV